MSCGRWLDHCRSPALFGVAAIALPGIIYYIPLLLSFAQGMLADGVTNVVADRDFANYWMGARMALAGEHHDLFVQETYFEHLRATFGPDTPWRNWGYAPHYLLMILPLGWLGYKSAMAVFLLSTLLLFVLAAMTFRREYAPQSDWRLLALAVAGYALMMIDTAQNGFLFGAMLLFGLAWRAKRPLLAGIAFAALTVKPQLGFLIPVLLLIERRWWTLAWATLATAVLVALSVLAFGADSWSAYLSETLAYQRTVMTNGEGLFLRMMPTVFGSIRTLGSLPEVAFSAQWPASLCGGLIVVVLLWLERDALRAAFFLACGTFVISPYAFNYDMGALAVIAAVLAGQGTLRWGGAATVAAVAGFAGVVMPLGLAGVPVAPLLLMSGVVAVAWDNRRRSRRDSGVNSTTTPCDTPHTRGIRSMT